MEYLRENGYHWVDAEIYTVLDQMTGQLLPIKNNCFQGTLDEAIARAKRDPNSLLVVKVSAVMPFKLG